MPITIEPSFLIVVGLFGLFAPSFAALVVWVVVVTVSVLVHELGHAGAFRLFGSPAEIRLQGMGGLTSGTRLPPAQNLAVSLAGPGAGLVLLGLPALVLHAASPSPSLVEGSTAEQTVTYLFFVNVVWSLVNLLPVLPLDGGNVVHSLFDLVTGRDAEVPARVVSMAVAGAGGLVAASSGMPVLVLLAVAAVVFNLSALRHRRERSAAVPLWEARNLILEGRSREAVGVLEPLVESGPSLAVRRGATELSAWALLVAGDTPAARRVLTRSSEPEGGSAALAGAIALEEGHPDQGLALLTYGLAHQEDALAAPSAMLVADRHGLAEALVSELLAVGAGAGLPAAEVGARALHRAGRFHSAADVAARLAREGGPPAAAWAVDTACSVARTGHPEVALAWLVSAERAGWHDDDRLRNDQDLVAVRALPGFAHLAGAAGPVAR